MGLLCNSASVFGLGDVSELVRRGWVSRHSTVLRVGAYTLIRVPKRHVNRLVLRTCNTPLHKLPVRYRPRCFCRWRYKLPERYIVNNCIMTPLLQRYSGTWRTHLTFLDLLDVVLEAVKAATK